MSRYRQVIQRSSGRQRLEFVQESSLRPVLVYKEDALSRTLLPTVRLQKTAMDAHHVKSEGSTAIHAGKASSISHIHADTDTDRFRPTYIQATLAQAALLNAPGQARPDKRRANYSCRQTLGLPTVILGLAPVGVRILITRVRDVIFFLHVGPQYLPVKSCILHFHLIAETRNKKERTTKRQATRRKCLIKRHAQPSASGMKVLHGRSQHWTVRENVACCFHFDASGCTSQTALVDL